MADTMAARKSLQRAVERQDWCWNGRWSLALAAFDWLTGLSQVGSGQGQILHPLYGHRSPDNGHGTVGIGRAT